MVWKAGDVGVNLHAPSLLVWRAEDGGAMGVCGGLGTHVWTFLLYPVLWPQLRQRFELEIERMKQMHQKDREDQEEEMEDVRQSCQKRVRELRAPSRGPTGEDAGPWGLPACSFRDPWRPSFPEGFQGSGAQRHKAQSQKLLEFQPQHNLCHMTGCG